MKDDVMAVLSGLEEKVNSGTIPLSPNYLPTLQYLMDYSSQGGRWMKFNAPAQHIADKTGTPLHVVYRAISRLVDLGILYATGQNAYGTTYSWGSAEIISERIDKAKRPPNSDVTGVILSALPGTVTQLATATGLPKTTVSRIVSKLETDGVVATQRVANTKRVELVS